MVEYLVAAITGVLMGCLDLGPLSYRYYSSWAGRRKTRIAIGAILFVNGLSGLFGSWFVQFVSGSHGVSSAATVEGNVLIAGIASGAVGYGITHAQIPRLAGKGGDVVSLIGRIQTFIIDILNADCKEAMQRRIGDFSNQELAERCLEALHEYINNDAELNSLMQKKFGTLMRQQVKNMRSSDADCATEGRAALRSAYTDILVQYRSLDPSTREPRQLGAGKGD